MDTNAQFSINLTGSESGTPYFGPFTVKTLLSRRERFIADEARRVTLGLNATTALDELQKEAYILGQLSVRIVTAPDWWTKSNNGHDLPDGNVIAEIYNQAIAKEKERKDKLLAEAKLAVDAMIKVDPQS